MPKKNKPKAVQNKLPAKSAIKKESKEQSKPPMPFIVAPPPLASNPDADDTGIDVNDLADVSLNNSAADVQHKEQLASISTMLTRVDEHIIKITALQKQLSELQMKQIRLLDGCVNFFQELQGFNSKNDEEEKLVVDTFLELQTKVKVVFKHYLPTHIDTLERDMKMLQLNQQPH